MLTPGVSVSRSSNLRPRIGVVSIVFWSSVLAAAVRVASIDRRLRGDGHGLGHARHLHARVQPHRLAHRDEHVLLDERRETGERERHRVASGRNLQRHEPPVTIARERSREVRVDVADFDIDAWQHRAAGIDDDAFDDGCGDLRLRQSRRGKGQRENSRGEPDRDHDPRHTTSCHCKCGRRWQRITTHAGFDILV